MGVWTCPDCGADDMMGTVDHGINCPRYDGPPPESEGFAELRQLHVLGCAYVAYVKAACYAHDHKTASDALKACLRVTDRLGVPEYVRPCIGEDAGQILFRFAKWVEEQA